MLLRNVIHASTGMTVCAQQVPIDKCNLHYKSAWNTLAVEICYPFTTLKVSSQAKVGKHTFLFLVIVLSFHANSVLNTAPLCEIHLFFFPAYTKSSDVIT